MPPASSSRRFRAPGALLLFALALGGAYYARAAVKPSVDSVAEGLTCQCGCGLTVANCNHPQCEFSVPVRDQIEKMIAQGRSREQIIEAFRVKYGEKILSAPTTSGFNLLAWITPFGVIAIGGALLVMVFSRWTSGQPSLPARLDEQNFDAALRRRLDDEVRKDA
ncbi:MAG TPA: cytochrome c-type biogenesis protein CcmH [Candidatus Binataceae bacterium]|nr:cytochrome c-type biogenesis protein CcmH [Candidatus Binataceae bacterium]